MTKSQYLVYLEDLSNHSYTFGSLQLIVWWGFFWNCGLFTLLSESWWSDVLIQVVEPKMGPDKSFCYLILFKI